MVTVTHFNKGGTTLNELLGKEYGDVLYIHDHEKTIKICMCAAVKPSFKQRE